MDNLRVGAYGWKHENWLDSFYPEDLPGDWQLTYYANEFSCVLMPAHYLLADDCDIEQWLDDVPDTFKFYVEWPDSDVDDDLLLNQLLMFGDQLSGILIKRSRQLATKIPVYCWSGCKMQQQLWQPDNQGQSGVAAIAIDGHDLKTQKHWLQKFQKDTINELKAVFLMDENLDIKQLNEFKILVELK